MGGEGGGRDGWRGMGEWTEWVGEENRQRKRQLVRGGEEGGDTYLPKGFSEAVVVEEGRDVGGG